jgi:hypothetical protein
MRKILGFGIVLASACLTGTSYGQGGGAATVGGRQGTTENSSLVTAPNNLEQKANEQAEQNGTPVANTAVPGVNTAAPGGTATVPGSRTGAGLNTAVPGSTETPAQTAGIGANTTPPGANSATGTPGIGAQYATPGGMNRGAQVGTTNAAPGVGDAGMPAGTTNAGTTYTPGMANPGEWNYRTDPSNASGAGYQQGGYQGTATAATPGYTGRTMPGMAGYNNVNPMGTTMVPPYYYAGTAGMPYPTYSNPGYNAGYTNPGYTTTTYQSYNVRPRRGLFGRRNRVAYPATPYGYNMYSNGYSSPYGYSSYGTTTYHSTPGAYPN